MLCYVFFFFKQKTAYEMRISDWSSDVCSSDLENSQWTIWTTIFPQSISGKETPAVPRTRWTETGPEASPRTVKSLNHLSGTTNRSRQRNGPIWQRSNTVRQATLANKAMSMKPTGRDRKSGVKGKRRPIRKELG